MQHTSVRCRATARLWARFVLSRLTSVPVQQQTVCHTSLVIELLPKLEIWLWETWLYWTGYWKMFQHVGVVVKKKKTKTLLNSLILSVITWLLQKIKAQQSRSRKHTERETKLIKQMPAVISRLGEHRWDSEIKVTGKEQFHCGAGGIFGRWIYNMSWDSTIYTMKCQAMSTLLFRCDGFGLTSCPSV